MATKLYKSILDNQEKSKLSVRYDYRYFLVNNTKFTYEEVCRMSDKELFYHAETLAKDIRRKAKFMERHKDGHSRPIN